ncbi:ComF family protein [Mitsuaria sp. WAJ17]|uniref:ComF family protein n=1 Tax=Mitsuaria sp. WAJ17 TaxID=2761452 RepID=UPI001600AA84|nr:ComF family protein [Mitsuaria sp. WAJ17]MBB2486620.1 ComF family protein [Mitsuaria sp. WAJ17]
MPAAAWIRAKALLPRGSLGGQCLLCRQWSQERLCTDCLSQAARRDPRRSACGRCALPLAMPGHSHCATCLRRPPPLDHCCAALDYHHPWDRLLLDFKFNAQPQLARPLAALMLPSLQGQVQALGRPDLLCCVPLSAQRLRDRGYNQSHELARCLARQLQLPYEPRLLRRLPGAPQSRLDAEARRRHVRGAFVLATGMTARVRGARVAIIDDVMTTGATLDEIASTLKRAGAAQAWGWALMRAG